MGNRLVPILLLLLLVILQGQLWFGRGSITSVAHLRTQLDTQKLNNVQSTIANDRLNVEINDLQEGLEMVEERARAELGMVRNNEIYVQIAH